MDIGVLATNPTNPALPDILGRDGVDTLSLAITGARFMGEDGATPDFPLLNQGLAVARAAGKKFTPRIRMGASSPIAYKYRTIIPTSGVPKGKVVPMPVLEFGAPNVVWLAGMQKIIDALAPWVRANMVPEDGPVHLSHYGGLSAELYVSEQMMAMDGLNQATLDAANVALVRLVAGMDVPNPVEVSISGLEPIQAFRNTQAAITAAMAEAAQRRPFWTQRNGYTGDGNPAGAPHPAVGYMLQMIKPFRPDGTPWNWPVAVPRAATVARALEVYDTSFGSWKSGRFVTAPGGAELFAACAKV